MLLYQFDAAVSREFYADHFQKDSKECLTEGNGRAKVMKSLRAIGSLKTEQYSEQ